MYQALYRKWRPKTFDEVVGQKHITDTLKNQVNTGRLSHAYLFIGTRGTGKTSCAKILARVVNCERPINGNPCNECSSCVGIESGAIPDVVELDAASNNGVDNVRALRDEAVFSPAIVKKRVYIIDEVHMLSISAFNALLKILEEPPEHLMFILATTELHKVPATILSRCQRHGFKRIDNAMISDRLMYIADREQLQLDPDAARLLSRLSDGSLRDALSLLDQCSGTGIIDSNAVLSAIGLAGNRRITGLLEAIASNDCPAVLSIFQELWQDGKSPATLLGELGTLLRDTLMLAVAPSGGNDLISGGFDINTLKGFGAKLTTEALMRSLDEVQSALGEIRGSQSARITAELCLISLCQPELGDNIPALMTRIARLENKIAINERTLGAHEHPSNKESDSCSGVVFEQVASFEKDTAGSEAFAAMPENQDIPGDALFVEPEPAPEHPSSQPLTGDGNVSSDTAFWDSLLEALEGKLPIGTYNLLFDTAQVTGIFEGDELFINISPGFAMNMLNKPDITKQLGLTSEEILGRSVRVRLIEAGPNYNSEPKDLDELGKYGIVTFK